MSLQSSVFIAVSLQSSVFIAVSLDGFIARAGGELDWLEAANATVPEGEDWGYHAFMETVAAASRKKSLAAVSARVESENELEYQ